MSLLHDTATSWVSKRVCWSASCSTSRHFWGMKIRLCCTLRMWQHCPSLAQRWLLSLSRAAATVGSSGTIHRVLSPRGWTIGFVGWPVLVPSALPQYLSLPEVHEEVTKSWKAPFSARSQSGPSSSLTTLDGGAAKGYVELPRVEWSVAMQLCPTSWQGNLRLSICCAAHADSTSGRLSASWVESLCFTSLPHPGNVCDSVDPAGTVSGSLSSAP